MLFRLPDLPYPKDALEPHMSAKTLDFHHGKHHHKYVDTLNELIEGSPLADKGLVEIIRETATTDKPDDPKIFNNAAQVWNHNFFWNSMTPEASEASGEIARRIEAELGGLEAFKAEFEKAATGQFGSGWAWLVLDGGKLRVIATPNAVPPIIYGQKALLTCDVWEHAYYLDYQNRRGDFVQAFLDHLVNWDFAAANLRRAGEA